MSTTALSGIRKSIAFLLLLGVIFAVSGLYKTLPVEAAAGVNEEMNFQGRLLNAQGATVPDGNYNIQFKIYQDGDGQTVGNATGSPAGSLKWTESHLNANGKGITVKNGYMSVQLGSVTPFGTSVDWNQDTLWLSMNIANTNATCTPFTACSPDGEMVPMKRLSSSPYALNAGRLGGLTSDQFIQSSTSPQLANIAVESATAGTVATLIQGTTSQTADILQVKAKGTVTPLLALGPSGDINIQGTADSADAFNVKNKDGTSLLNVNTVTSSVNLNADVTVAAGKTITMVGGTTALRPASPTEGMVYYDTDTKQLLTYSGGKWQGDRSSSSVIVGTSASGGVSGAVASKSPDGADFVNTSTSSAQTTIQSAISALPSDGGMVYLMEGTYIVDGSISVPSNVTITGAGSATVIKLKNAIGAISFNIFNNSDTTNGNSSIVVRDIRLDGNKVNNGDGTLSGIGFTKVAASTTTAGARLSGLVIENFNTNGITLASSTGAMVNSNTIRGNTQHGVYLHTAATNNTIGNNIINSNGSYGIYLSSSTTRNNTITANALNGNQAGMVLSSAQYNVISSNSINASTAYGIYLPSASHNSLTNNTIADNASYGLRISGDANVISGNKVHNNGGSAAYDGISFTGNSSNNSITNNDISDTAGTGYAIRLEANTVTDTFISANRYSGTGAASINDLGANTIYSGQLNGSGTLVNQSAAGTSIQNASGTSLLSAGVTTDIVRIGSATADATGVLVVLDTKNTAGDPSGFDGAMYYNSSAGKFRCYQNSAWTDCITTAASAVTLQSAYNNSGTVDPHILLSSTNGGLKIRDSATPISGNLLSVASSDGSIVYAAVKSTGIETVGLTARATGATGNALLVQNASGHDLMSIDNSNNNVSVGSTSAATTGTTTLQGKDSVSIATNGTVRATFNNSNTLYLGNGTVSASPANFTISGTSSNTTDVAGGIINIQGGNATVGNASGGALNLSGGSGIGTGTNGLVNLGASANVPITNAACAVNCTIPQNYVDNYGTVVVSASVSDVTITLPPPTNTAAVGRILYLTTTSDSLDYNLTTNSGADVLNISMRQNSTATMVWSGSAWAPGGASNATTLQATYNNGKNPSTTPEIKLDSTRGTIDIQDADVSIGSDIFNIRGSNANGLGTVLFGVSNSGRVTIQDTSDQSSSFRVLNSAGSYLFNVNSNNNYTFSNGTRSAGNEIANSNFEAGGSTQGGEEGWLGPVQSNFVNSSTDARNGNYSLQVTPNASNLDVFAGSYYEVTPGDSLYLEGYAKNSSGANGDAGVQITWYNKDKGVISNTTSYSGLPGTSYVLRKVNGTAPAGASYARVSATVRSTATTGTFYFDDFYMKRSVENSDYTFRNSQNSTAAFRIQSAGSAQTLLTADTSNNILKVGDSTGSNTDTTILVLDGTTADPTTLTNKDGGLFYNSATNSLKAVIGGAVVDVCTTAITCTGYSASASSGIQLQGTSPGTAQIGHFNITGTGILTQLQTQDRSAASTNSDNLTIRTGNATGSGSVSGNLTIDTGTGTAGRGSITIGSSGVAVSMGGNLNIQGADTLALGTSNTNTGSVLFRTAAGGNTIKLQGPGANPASSFTLTLPQNLTSAGHCLKDTGSGVLGFSDCGAGLTVNLQDVYNNSSPATTTLADAKNYKIAAQDTLTDPSILFDLQCVNGCGTNGTFSIQNNGTDVFTVKPNGGGIVLNGAVQIGNVTTDSTQVNLKLDSSNNTTDIGSCTTTLNQGAMYYNTSMGSIRACMNGAWSDMSNPDTLGLLSFGIVPSTGVDPYDLPSLKIPGASGPCKVSWASNTSVSIESCVAYSGGRRVNVLATTLNTNSTSANHINLTTTNRWGHICLDGIGGQPRFTTTLGLATALEGMPNSTVENQVVTDPILCLASVQGESTVAGRIDNIYDVRTFTSSFKEAVTVSTAVELGMITDASATTGAMIPAVNNSKKLYGLVVATDGGTSTGTPNTIVTTMGPGWVKATAGTSGQFIKTSVTDGYGDTTASIPNNSFYYSVGNTRTNYSTTCTAANNCSGSLYANFIVR